MKNIIGIVFLLFLSFPLLSFPFSLFSSLSMFLFLFRGVGMESWRWELLGLFYNLRFWLCQAYTSHAPHMHTHAQAKAHQPFLSLSLCVTHAHKHSMHTHGQYTHTLTCIVPRNLPYVHIMSYYRVSFLPLIVELFNINFI